VGVGLGDKTCIDPRSGPHYSSSMKVNVQYAETHLADLISAASRGEIVEIEGPENTAQLLTFPTLKTGLSGGRRILGAARGKFAMPSDEEWRAADKELEHMMNNGPIFPDESR
jgi:hypothetical protein